MLKCLIITKANETIPITVDRDNRNRLWKLKSTLTCYCNNHCYKKFHIQKAQCWGWSCDAKAAISKEDVDHLFHRTDIFVNTPLKQQCDQYQQTSHCGCKFCCYFFKLDYVRNDQHDFNANCSNCCSLCWDNFNYRIAQ